MVVIVIDMYTWTLTLREEHRLRALENGVLWRVGEGGNNGGLERVAQ